MKKTLLFACVAASTMKISAGEANQPKPNIIWITCEDISPFIGAYGDRVVKTPNIDQLAREGVKYNDVHTVAGVSSPSRSCIITGMYPTSIGTQHMRTLMPDAVAKRRGLVSYSAVIPDYIKCFPEYLRMQGYFTSNNEKTDYQFIEPVTVWDENNVTATYKNRAKRKPFFSVFNFFITHESQILGQKDSALLVEPNNVYVPPYYNDTHTVRKDIARLLTNIEILDRQVGQLIDELKKEGLYDDTYIFFFSDHGGNLPWMKREILERGTHIPFIIKHPKGIGAGTENNELISSIDFAPTILSLAGIKIPNYMQGQAFLGKQASKTARKYAFAARDRLDEGVDRVRSVRDKRFRYVYNYHPELPRYIDVTYRLQIPMMTEMLQLHKNGKLEPAQEAWFTSPKPVEELYDLTNDPNELNNLATQPKYKKKLEELRIAFKQWTKQTGDMSENSEMEMVSKWWNGQNHAPSTEKPVITQTDGGLKISCMTKGASIGYRIIKSGDKDTLVNRKIHSWDSGYINKKITDGQSITVSPSWNIYKGQTIKVQKGDKIIVQAMRIGYEPSTIEYVQ